MELPVVDKFCFIFNLKSGCITMGIINAIFSFIQVAILIALAVDIRDMSEPPTRRDGDGDVSMSSVVFTIIILLIVLLIVKFVSDLMFIFAVYKEKCGMIRKYCVFWIVFLVLFIIGFLKSLFYMDAGYVISHIFYLAENFYFIVVIRSYLLSIDEDGVL